MYAIQEIRQSDLKKKIEKAIEDAGLVSRDVTPFIRVKVTGLNCIENSKVNQPKEGLITIWKPTEKQVMLKISIYPIFYNISLHFSLKEYKTIN